VPHRKPVQTVDNIGLPPDLCGMDTAQNTPLPLIEDPDMGITLSDGCRLSARVWRPENSDTAPVPVILEYLPYRKRDGTTARDALTHPWFAERGYACVRVDMRGNGDSYGVMEDEYTPPGTGRLHRGDQLACRATLVQRNGRHDGHQLGRL